ncbi:MAG: hypothetical protein KDJ87_21460 [Rhizobiaceae bacterium]|nr:hypothetical protein [Rhizobiaceae bacterium]
MPKTIKNDRVTTWEINGDHDTWTLEKQASIVVDDQAAIDVLNTSVANTLRLLGDILATGEDGQGVHVSGVNTKIVVGKSADIVADEAIHATAGGLSVVNRGDIDGFTYGISNSAASTIRNFGDIGANIGISTLGTSKVVNGENGVIQGDFAGVVMTAGSDSVLINHGLIAGNDFAIRLLNGGETRLVNTGSIHGDIVFSTGNDLFDTRKGTMDGTVTGGAGDDTYKIGKNDIAIVEADDGGHDALYSSASIELADHIEDLFLRGKQNIDGEGNDEDNRIFGNAGDNFLYGKEGNDTLGGNAGDDALFGGDGDDVFVFNRGDDHDRIYNFISGEDTIQMNGFEGIDSFADLSTKMFKNGSDVWIQLGKGDRLVIKGIDTSDLDAADFDFNVL